MKLNRILLVVLVSAFVVAVTEKKKKKKDVRVLYSKKSTKKVMPAECDLTMEVQQLYYIPIVRASTFKLGFSSACLTKREINFQIYHDDNKHINIYHNPTKINLHLWGNKYFIKYSKPAIIDKHDIMKSLEYKEALLTPLLSFKSGFKIDTTTRNDIFLDPQIDNTFNKYTILKLANVEGIVRCKIKKVMVKNWQKLKADVEKRKAAKLAEEEQKKKIMAEAEAKFNLKNKEDEARASAIARNLADKAVKTLKNVLPEAFKTEPKKIKELMKKEWIEDYEIDCEIK